MKSTDRNLEGHWAKPSKLSQLGEKLPLELQERFEYQSKFNSNDDGSKETGWADYQSVRQVRPIAPTRVSAGPLKHPGQPQPSLSEYAEMNVVAASLDMARTGQLEAVISQDQMPLHEPRDWIDESYLTNPRSLAGGFTRLPMASTERANVGMEGFPADHVEGEDDALNEVRSFLRRSNTLDRE